VRDGLPVLDDGRALDVTNVTWCTRFRPDFSWIHLPVTGDDGWPRQERGVAGTSLTGPVGVGPDVAAAVIGDVRHVSRFPNRDHFAAYNGTAPIEVSSGGPRQY